MELVGGRAAHPRVRGGPGRRGVRGRAGRAAGRAAGPVPRTVARLRELGLPIDAQVAELELGVDDALGRPTSPGRSSRPGFAEQRRGRLQPAHRARGAGLRAARRASARTRRSPPSRPPAGSRSSRTSGRRRRRSTCCASSSTPAWRGLEIHYRSFDAATRRGGRRPSRAGSASSRPAARTTTATSARTPRPTPSLWVPPEVGERLLEALAR